jgi:hypothetical protein
MELKEQVVIIKEQIKKWTAILLCKIVNGNSRLK